MNLRFVRVTLLALLACCGMHALAAELDPKAVTYLPLDKIPWRENAAGTNANAILYGDLTKPGPYAYFVKWKAGNMSRPHWHPNDRYIMVVSGTWWVGSGPRFDPEATIPMPAGTYVVHYGKGIHYDGAKEGDAILLIHGVGPATSTPAEQKQ